MVERSILPGEIHHYLLEADRGDFFEYRIDQFGIDVGLTLFDPRGEGILEMDLPIADVGPEIVMAVADRPGVYRLAVKASDDEDPGGSYQAALTAHRPAGAVERLRARAVQSFDRGERLYWSRKRQQAIAEYERSLGLWRQAADELWQAETLDRLGDTHFWLGELRAAAELLEEAGARFDRLDEPQLAVVSANRLAQVYYALGDMDRALRQHEQALELRRRLDDRRGEGMSLASMAAIYKVQGETQSALDCFELALALLNRPEDRRYRATPLHDLGTLYRQLGKSDEAMEHLREAARIFEESDDLGRQASSLSQIGQLVFETGEPDRALLILRQALELRRHEGAVLGEAAALHKIGSVLVALGDSEGARQRYLEALELLQGGKSPRSQATVLANLGALDSALGDDEGARDYYLGSLALVEQVGDPVGQAEALLGVALAERRLGRPGAALKPAARALEIAEELRIKPLNEDLRLSFFSTAQRFFDFNIDLLMELSLLDPQAGHAEAALQVSERARARSLLDLLSEAGAEIRDEAAPALLAEESKVQRSLNRSVEIMEDAAAGETEREAAAQRVRRAIDRLNGIRSAIRRDSPRYAELTQPPLLTVGELQKELLDEDTLLLEYRLGAERSFLWLAGVDRFAAFELDPAPEIERNAREAHRLLAQSWRRESVGRTRAVLCELSRQLLQPVAGRLGRKRLAIVADGALEYLPFVVLPDPDSPVDCRQAEPLLTAHEIIHLPSASTAAVLRREAEGRSAFAGQVAVIADPVFSLDDPRVGKRWKTAVGSDSLAAGATRSGTPVALRRLPYSRAEASAIVSLVPAGQAFTALDFDASKEVVLSDRLSGYRAVHFGTHGTLNAEQPALSQVVLSLVDRQGRAVDGTLRAHEIFNLRLRTDLVVLAGCETALGKQVRGEGLVGLARGFMYAGASRVMASLWNVSDRGTADLMQAFYRALLVDELAPAAALRRAQLEARQTNPQPFYWGGFVVLGDWRGRQ